VPICLAIAVFLISGLFSNMTLDPVLLPRFLVGSIFVFGFVLMIAIQVTNSQTGFDFGIIHRVIFLAFICYLTISGLSLINAINLTEGLFEWLKLFLFTAFFYSALLIILKNRNGITILVRGIILTATILSGIGICQYYRLAFTSIPGNYIIYATLANKNLYASALFLMLPFAAYSVYRFSRFWQLAGWIAVISLLFSVFLARARTIWLAIIIATVAVVVMIIIKHREEIRLGWQKWIRFNRYKIASGLLFFLVLTITLVQLSDEIVNSLPSAGVNKVSTSELNPFVEPVWSMNTLKERFFLWDKSIAMAKANPLLGVGLGQWRLTFPAYGKIQQFRESDEGPVEIHFRRPHNDYVWVLTETGMIGLLSYLAILGVAIIYALKIYFKSDDANNRALAIFMLFGIIGHMVTSFFSFPKERILHNIIFMLNLACIVSTYHRSFPKKYKFNRQQILIINCLTLIALSFCMIVGFICLDSETHVKKALTARQEKDWQTVIAEIDKAESSFYQIDPVSVPLAWYRGVANQLMGQLGKALDDFKRAYQIHPNHIHVLNNLGTGYAQTGDYENAASYYKKALEVWPEFAAARINLGIIYFHLGDFAEARRCFMLLDRNREDAQVSVYLQFIENKLGKSI
jgi:O-antigen ligase